MTTGRDSIFRGKDKTLRYQGVVTQDGADRLEEHRAALGLLFESIMGRRASVGDSDVMEYLARGKPGTVRYLKDRKRAGD